MLNQGITETISSMFPHIEVEADVEVHPVDSTLTNCKIKVKVANLMGLLSLAGSFADSFLPILEDCNFVGLLPSCTDGTLPVFHGHGHARVHRNGNCTLKGKLHTKCHGQKVDTVKVDTEGPCVQLLVSGLDLNLPSA